MWKTHVSVYWAVRTPHGGININTECYFSPITSFSYIWLTSLLIFNNISEDSNTMSSLILFSSFPFPSLNKAEGRRDLGCSLCNFLSFWTNKPKGQPVLCMNSHVAGEQEARCPHCLWMNLLDGTPMLGLGFGVRAIPCTHLEGNNGHLWKTPPTSWLLTLWWGMFLGGSPAYWDSCFKKYLIT